MKCKNARKLLAKSNIKRISLTCHGVARVDYGSGWMLTPRYFGAVGDCITDDAKAFQAMVDHHAKG